MALEQHTLDFILRLKPKKLLCLGYPDILTKSNKKIEGSESIAQWHGWSGAIGNTDEIFADAGIEPTYIDVAKIRGPEEIVDLNQPIPPEYINKFDAVLDPGTIEHCFNIGQAFKNIILALKIGGHAVHTNPMLMVNHGFWNVCPTAYFDFYRENGCELKHISVIYGSVDDRRVVDIAKHIVSRVELPLESSNLVIAKKISEKEIVWPTQYKYQRLLYKRAKNEASES